MIGALAYLIVVSTRNKIRARIQRIRNPRYAIAFLLGLGYFWLVFFNSSNRGNSDASNPAAAIGFGAFIGLTMFLTTAYAWIFGADRSALAFSQAESTMLFTAPMSRRALILYKLARLQAALLTTTFIWVVLFRRGEAGITGFVSLWVLLTTIALHRLGVALMHVSRQQHGSAAFKRNWIAALLFAAILVAVAAGAYAARDRFAAASGGQEFSAVLSDVMSHPPTSWALLPFRIAAAPTFLRGSPEWPQAFMLAVALMLAHLWWVLRGDTAFEEAAAEASVAQAKRIEAIRTRSLGRQVIQTKGVRRTFALAPHGIPAVAIVWKNLLWLVRTGQLRGLIGLPLVAFSCAVFFAHRSQTAEVIVAALCGVSAILAMLFGPMTMRNDLRGELLNLPMIKTLPVRGRYIMIAEVMSSALPTAALQFFVVAAGILALSFVREISDSGAIRLQLLVAAPVLLAGLNVANFTIHNGLALLFPAWVRLGETNPGGVETMGQMMLTLILTIVMLAALLIIPAALGGVTFVALRFQHLPAYAVTGLVVGSALLAESWLVLTMLGGSLEKLEPMQVS